MKPLVVISCGAKKQNFACQAKDMYVGSYFKAALRFALATTDEANIRILSAKYGLIKATDVIEPYEMRITDWRAAKPAKVIQQAKDIGDFGRTDVLVVAGKDYNFIIKSAFPNAKNVVAHGKGLGYQMQILKSLTDAASRSA